MEQDIDNEKYGEVIRAFRLMWENFPGMARIVDKGHRVIAANAAARAMGFEPGVLCSRVAPPQIHKKCRMAVTLKTGRAHTDRVIEDRIRGWQPVPGHPDLVVHFAIAIPEADPQG